MKNIVRGIMLFCALGALIAFVTGIGPALSVPSDQRIVEMWRGYGFIVFAAIYILLAFKPSQYPGIWEIAILHKLAMTVTALTLVSDNNSDAASVALIDGILTILTITAYLLSKSYTAWNVFKKESMDKPVG